MHRSVVKNKEGCFLYAQTTAIKILHKKLSVDGWLCACPIAGIAATDTSKDIDCKSFTDIDSNIFPRKLPAVGNIALAGNTAFIAIEQVDESLLRKTLQLLQTPVFMRIQFGVWFFMTPFSYPFVSSAKTFKKLRNVVRLAFLPLAACHSARAVSARR